jgi:archaeal type IV pilus assembly protein PilA
MWNEKAKSWRKRNKRGVSPIIATILLVAITVVLAAVLYILISGLTRGPGTTPIGSAFGMTSPNKEKGAASGTPGCATGDTCYTITIASAGGGITWSSVNYVIHDANGNPAAATSTVNIVNSTGIVVWSCTLGATCAIVVSGVTPTISTTETIVLDTHGTVALTGDTLIANGVGSYSSSTSVGLP